eukprot:PLAT10058.2.p1 GENE.PLAT10058.2~~PLAT10058.2.p1  ORF type:complete len:446 (+),score=194.31 PLAT10058.2:38-1375(+)
MFRPVSRLLMRSARSLAARPRAALSSPAAPLRGGAGGTEGTSTLRWQVVAASAVAGTAAALFWDDLSQPAVADSAISASKHSLPSEELLLKRLAEMDETSRDRMLIFAGNSNLPLAREVADHLETTLGDCKVGRFADGEVRVQIRENVRGKDVYIVQSTCTPVNDNLVELLLMISAMRRASARRITAVIPYYGYARQDRKMASRVPISAADVARMLEAMGVDRVIAVDLHCGQIQGFFGPHVPVDNLTCGPVGARYFSQRQLEKPVIVSPDAGGVFRAKKFRESMSWYGVTNDVGLAMIVKQRAGAGKIDSMDLVGNVTGSDVIVVDDIIDTAGTLCKAASLLKQAGARRVFAFGSHGIFSPPAASRLAESDLEEVVVSNTLPLADEVDAVGCVKQLSVAPLIAEAIFRIQSRQSVSQLFTAHDFPQAKATDEAAAAARTAEKKE